MHERTRPPLHERLSARAPWLRRAAVPAFAVAVAVAALSGIAGGLLRAGVALPGADGAWAGRAVQWHALLLIGGLLGTVIGIERAVALRRRWAWAAPLASAAGALALLAGRPALGTALFLVSSAVFAAVNAVVVRRQAATHTVLLLVAALAWAAGNGLALAGGDALPWWFTFLVLTIAAERLELTRLMHRPPAAAAAFRAIVALLVLGAAGSAVAPRAGGVVFGAALALLGLWLLRFDVARRTLHAEGLPRYIAICLLGGHAWLLTGGVAWAALALGAPTRDLALHALGLGFVIGMVLGHAPVILPAIAGVRMQFGPVFYLPLLLLHLSLLWRLVGGLAWPALRAGGAAGNALALAVFVATVAGAILRWRAGAAAAARRPRRRPPDGR